MSEWLLQFDFIKYGFCNNYWIWFHMGGGGVLALIAMRLLRWRDCRSTSGTIRREALLAVTVIAIGWEVIEALGGIDAYPSTIRWVYDSLGDIIGTVGIALMVVWRRHA